MQHRPFFRITLWLLLATGACSPREDESRLRKDWGECTRNTECGAGLICRNRKCVEPPPAPTGAALTPPGGMVHVPAGDFLMGANRGTPLERPQIQSRTPDFFIDAQEVTVEAYLACQKAGHCPEPRCSQPAKPAGLPVVCVTQDAAASYCAFLKKRLPTEEEWEKAARGAEARMFPWGEQPPTCERANFAGCLQPDGPTATGLRPDGAGPYGARDQAGNVWEWTASARLPWDKETDPARAQAGHAPPPAAGTPKNPPKKTYYVIRGGSFLDPPLSLRTSHRLLLAQDFYSHALGFRCAADPR